ncbi:MAG: helix-turn-helix domain-containing protein, partial [Planctomycetaceae bacterium]|nr:helix-turn-helix domain-containing protein [Planctomycetaceae bacterium]
MAKKYLSLEEAASRLGMSTDELMELRERGEIRGFADRGSWKFSEDLIHEYLRGRQADSSPDIPILNIDDDDDGSVLIDDDIDLSSSDSDVRLSFDEPLGSDQSRGLRDSGSDVRLSGDSGPSLQADDDDAIDLSGWDSDANLSDSDSDVRIVGGGTDADIDLASTSMMDDDSDSDVVLSPADDLEISLSDSDSDVRLSDDPLGATDALHLPDLDSDSDVKLMGTDDLLGDDEDSDSDVKLSGGLDRTDSDIRLIEPGSREQGMSLLPDDSDLKLIDTGSGRHTEEPDSGITLQPSGSALGLEADESGISLEIDSGISLHADDSGISLESFDSSAALGDDSGITLDAGDSGISLDLADDSGIALAFDDEEETNMNRTMPMQAISGAEDALRDSDMGTTQFEIPDETVGADSEFELAGLDDADDDIGHETSVLMFEDEGDVDFSQTVAAPAIGASVPGAVAEEDEFADDEYEEDFDDELADDEFDDIDDAEDFDDEFDHGGSQGVAATPTFAAPAVEADWGMFVKIA